jgi:hypothetical protein
MNREISGTAEDRALAHVIDIRRGVACGDNSTTYLSSRSARGEI